MKEGREEAQDYDEEVQSVIEESLASIKRRIGERRLGDRGGGGGGFYGEGEARK